MRRMRHLKPRELQSCDVAYQFWRPETLFDATSGGSPVAAGGAIARAEDVSGNGFHATQSTPGARPTRQVAARNGLDAARFDGADDFLNAGDVADMLVNPVEYYAVFIRTGSAGLKGVFGKSVATVASGRWTLINESGNDSALFAGSNSSGTQANISASTNLQSLFAHHPRGNSVLSITRNAVTTVTASAVDDGTSYNTASELLVGAYQNPGGFPAFSGSFIGADMIECAKFSRNFGTHVRLRTQHAAMRRARISS